MTKISDVTKRSNGATGGSGSEALSSFSLWTARLTAVGRDDTGRYNERMITRGIRELVARDWEAARKDKDAYWGERIARFGPLEGLRVAEELRRQALLLHPDWPDAALRRADLLSHVRLAELFLRAGSTRRR